MVANPKGAATPVGVWLDADAAPVAGESKTGRPQVKSGGKGTQGGSGKLAYRPGWHLGEIPYALQFNRKDAEGNRSLFPKNFVFAEVEYAADKNYQDEAHAEGINANGKYQHSLAGLKHLPTDGYYKYRTNPNPETDPWIITGAMKVTRLLTRAEQAELVEKAGREPQKIQDGDIVTDEVVNSINQEIESAPKFSLRNKVDNQGNPLNADGSLKLDKIKSVDELTDDDFLHPTRNIQMPILPKKVADVIGTDSKPVIIKKNIFERNYIRHNDVTPEQSRIIFNAALYNPDLYGQNQKKKRPYNWVLINIKDEEGKNRTILLEVNPNKNNVEIVHWFFVNNKNLGLIKKQAIREGDQILILPSEQSEEVGGLSNLTDDLSAANIDNSSETSKQSEEKYSLKTNTSRQEEIDEIIAYAKANGSYMKAPNGEPTKLSETQWAQVRTSSFKNWFGDWENDPENASKVVDENGEPLVVYHGTTIPDIHTFDMGKAVSGKAFWFSNEAAQKLVFYGAQSDPNLILMPLYVNMKKPLLNDDHSMEDFATDEFHDGGLILGRLKDFKGSIEEEDYQNALAKGIKENDLVASGNVTNPNQLKSATDNNGDFSTENDDIRYSLKSDEAADKEVSGTLEDIAGSRNATVKDAEGASVAVTDSNGHIKMSLKTYKPWTDNFGIRHNGTRETLLDYLRKTGASEKDIQDFADEMDYWNKYLTKIADFRNADGTFRFKAFHDWNLKQPQYKKVGRKIENVISTAIQNGEYAVNQELSTDCIKREAFTQLVNGLVAQGADLSDMGPRQISVIKDLMRQYGVQVACDLCFVEGKRLGIVNWAQTFVDDWNKALESMGFNPDELETFDFGSYARDENGNLIDDATFVPTEAFDNADATQWKAVNEVFNILCGRDKAYYDDLKKRNEANWKAYRKANIGKWAEYKKAMSEGKKWKDEYLSAAHKKIRNAFLTFGVKDPQQLFRNSVTYAETYRKMEDEFLQEHPDDIFTPNREQQNELNKIRNNKIKDIFGKMQRLIAEYPEMRKRMQLSDLLGSKGLMQIRQENGEAHAQLWALILGRFGSGTPKPIQDAVPYSGEVFDITDGLLSQAYAEGGARMFSFSDFDITKTFDIMQIIWDMAARKMKLQSYSKEASFVTMFGKNGIKINISTLPKAVVTKELATAYRNAVNETERKNIQKTGAEYAGLILDNSGNIVDMSWSEEHSAKPDFCQRIFRDPERNADCGAITVGASVNHALFAAAQDWIRMVIPFHLSGMPLSARERTDVNWYYDNTPYQNTRVKIGNGFVSINSPKVKQYNKMRKKKGLDAVSDYNFYANEGEGWDMRDECRKYVKWCEENGYKPRFEWGIDSEHYKSYCEENGYKPNQQIVDLMDNNMTDGVWNGYYKFITDFNCYKPVLDKNGEPVYDENGHLVETVAHHTPVRRGISLSENERLAVFGDAVGDASKLSENSMLQHRTESIGNANAYMPEMTRRTMDYLIKVHKYKEGQITDAEMEEADAEMKGEGNNFFNSANDADILMNADKMSLKGIAEGKTESLSEMSERLKEMKTADEVDNVITNTVDAMPEGWKQANKKAINIARAMAEDRKAEIKGEGIKFSLRNAGNSLIKGGTYFSGGGLVEEGLKGVIDPVLAVEYDEKISGVYRNNFGQHIVTADVRDVDPRELVKQIDGEVEYFHASPVCKNYSSAKANHEELELDKETAQSTAEFISKVRPKVVTIENVKGYRDSEAMKTITDALDANGYKWDADVYNAADYGGYTNRERLIVRAVRDGELPAKPKKKERKSGWFEAVEDIMPTLTEKKNGIAPWMDVRLKADGIDWRNIDKPLYVMGSAYADGKIPHAFADELLPTLRTKSGDVIVMPDGKVYRATGRVLARVSGVSDDYKMPASEALSHTIIGNGIPTQLTENVIAPLVKDVIRPEGNEENQQNNSERYSLRVDRYRDELNQWKKDNNLPKDAVRPQLPIREPNESAADFMVRVKEYRKQAALWATAPKYEDHLLATDTAQGQFNLEMQRKAVQTRIVIQDSMLAIRKAQEAIMKEVGVDKLNDAEDAYTAENRSHGKAKNEFEEYNDEFLQPLRKAYLMNPQRIIRKNSRLKLKMQSILKP